MADKVTQQDPNNQEVKKGFVFNETWMSNNRPNRCWVPNGVFNL